MFFIGISRAVFCLPITLWTSRSEFPTVQLDHNVIPDLAACCSPTSTVTAWAVRIWLLHVASAIDRTESKNNLKLNGHTIREMVQNSESWFFLFAIFCSFKNYAIKIGNNKKHMLKLLSLDLLLAACQSHATETLRSFCYRFARQFLSPNHSFFFNVNCAYMQCGYTNLISFNRTSGFPEDFDTICRPHMSKMGLRLEIRNQMFLHQVTHSCNPANLGLREPHQHTQTQNIYASTRAWVYIAKTCMHRKAIRNPKQTFFLTNGWRWMNCSPETLKLIDEASF